MNAAGSCLFGIAFILYFASGSLYLGDLFIKTPRWMPIARLLARSAFVFHTLAMTAHGVAVHHAPFTDAWESLSFFAWSLTLLFLAMDWRTPLPSLGAFVMPLGFLAIFFSSVASSRNPPLIPALQNHALKLHIAISLLGYGSFALAFCAALVYLLQESRLKRKRLDGSFRRLLSLEQADHLANRFVGLGFAFLTLGLAMGLKFAADDWKGEWWLDPKVLSSFFTWLIFGTYLYLRSVAGWRGHKTMILLTVGFAAMLAGYFGINLTGAGRHAFPF
jgi:cytochrome c-type biogenesis protein CcsB